MTRIFAHRGYSAAYPENTMGAFAAALEAGCDGIELDVQLSRDGRLVVIHDESVDRCTDGSGRVRDLALEELRRLDAGASFKGGRASGGQPARIPTLEEVLALVRGGAAAINIELKNHLVAYPGLEEKAVAAVREAGMEGRVLFSSFNHPSLLRCKRLAPEIEIAFVVSCWMIEPGAYCEDRGAEYLNPRFGFLDAESHAELRRHGRRAQAWTVNEAAEMERLAALGVDSIITNEPGLARSVLGR